MTLDVTNDETLALAHLLRRTIVSRGRLAMPMCSRGTCAAGIIGEGAADTPRLAVGQLIGTERTAGCRARSPRLKSTSDAPEGGEPREDHDVD
jgi:hypothetical protein